MKRLILAAIVFGLCFIGTMALGEITGVTTATTSALDLRTKMNAEFMKCKDEIALKANSAATFTAAFLSGETTIVGAIEALAEDIDSAVTITVTSPLALDVESGVLSVDSTFGLPHAASGTPPVGACLWNTTDKKIYCQSATGVYSSAAMTLVE
jgi:hypothetical protein